ncbi:MAG TPA: DNA gyrase inhibitor YacG [Gammaproteobacteria bacterium]|nr:DNA gyrase inhibitor YacG [Gammaproteobacteria bacterium]
MTRKVNCPICGKRVPWDDSAPWRPFCSERCKLIDLGEWAGETRRIPGPAAHPPHDDRQEQH